MAANNDYRGYLRNTADVEAGHRLHPTHNSEPTHRPLLFGTLAVMGLLQVVSSVAILLHLTGYLQQVDLPSASHRQMEEVQTEPIIADALKDPRKGKRCKSGPPAAHLPISPHEQGKKGELKATMIQWDDAHGYMNKMRYHDGRILLEEAGFYYVYAKTCFRYYQSEDSSEPAATPVNVRNAQLIQYISHEIYKQNNKAVTLMKTGSTMRWDNTDYNMYCAQQGRGIRLSERDGLFVNVSNAWMLDLESEGTYFGAMKMGN